MDENEEKEWRRIRFNAPKVATSMQMYYWATFKDEKSGNLIFSRKMEGISVGQNFCDRKSSTLRNWSQISIVWFGMRELGSGRIPGTGFREFFSI